MSQLDLARLQFAMTSIYHFLFVPVTIGLAFLTAVLQTSWHRVRPRRVPAADPVLRDAAGHQHRGRRRHRPGAGVPVRHGLVGVLALRSATCSARRWRWRGSPPSSSSRRSSGCGSSAGTGCRRRVHLAAIWAVALGAALSAAFIMAANSWMQHPVGYTTEPGHRQAAAQQHLGGADEPGVPLGLRARAARLAGHGVGGHARRLGLAAAPRLGHRTSSPGRPGWRSWSSPRPSSWR